MPDEYGSHLNVLASVLDQHEPKKVLELGAGEHSTPAFLNHPAVQELVTVEDDPDWRKRIKEMFPSDKLTISPKFDQSPKDFDLVFIDNGREESERLAFIRRVLSGPHPIVLIHDADVPAYNELIKGLADDFAIFPPTPHTAVIPACES
jgi:predicted O-methyltransferase YrrM